MVVPDVLLQLNNFDNHHFDLFMFHR